MTLPTQTWRVSASYPFTPAGTNPTIAEYLAAINTMLVAEAGLGSNWGVSDYSAVNGTLEIKRRGSPTGVLATFRELIFGGASPNTGALATGATAATTTLYHGCSQDAATTGPNQAYTAGTPYAGKLWSGGSAFAATATLTKTPTLPYVFMVESDECCHIHLADDTQSHAVTFGAVVERLADNTRVWASFGSGVAAVTAADYSSFPTWIISPSNVANATTAGIGTFHNGSAAEVVCRLMASAVVSASDPLFENPNGTLVPIVVTHRLQSESTANMKPLGILRQMRFGPNCINKIRIDDVSAVTQAYAVSSGYNKSHAGLYFDVAP